MVEIQLATKTVENMSSSNKYNFTGKVALVTGSSTGIGAAIALQFAQYGAQVVITGRSAEKLKGVSEKIAQVSKHTPVQVIGDFLSDQALPKKLIDETIRVYGRLDFLINNAGGATPKGNLESPNLLEEFDNVFKLNLRSVVALIQLAVPHLEKSQGSVINISSIGSVIPFQMVYSASKAALDMVTKTAALELGPKQIRVNSINPGGVVTEFLRTMGVAAEEQQAAYYEGLIASSLMGRIGNGEDIANLASFLVSDDARNITGSIYVSDSGALLKH